MLEIAHRRIPNLRSSVDDAANLDQQFREDLFDLVCTHLITGFCALEAPCSKNLGKTPSGGVLVFRRRNQQCFPWITEKSFFSGLAIAVR